MKVPIEIVDWLVQYAESNVELAVLSNISQSWRNRVMLAILKPAGCTSALLLPCMVASLTNPSSMSTTTDSFCAAWFPPEGIQCVQVPFHSDSDDDSETLFAPSGTTFKSFDRQENRTTILRSDSSSPSSAVSCSHEWRGYSQAWEVLEPFGYAKSFVVQTLERAQAMRSDLDHDGNTTNGVSYNLPTKYRSYRYKQNEHATTIAVRGATFARPEGYCLCWDHIGRIDDNISTLKAEDSFDQRQRDERNSILYYQSKKRRVLQQDLLPRVVLSSPRKNGLGTFEGGQLPSLQFLNSSGSNAVRLHTPPFDCGELHGPIVIFCVGIATEDGCFFSGLKHRCELGHMYPLNGRDAFIDMSPICLATDKVASEQEIETNSSTGFASDDSSCDSDEERRRRERLQVNTCDCPFEAIPGPNETEKEPEPVNEEYVHRGQRGPGNWHCYVVIFAGSKSMIRIDGMNESHTIVNSGDEKSITLDGLTIGSDHSFEMTLCSGEGCDEEGKGAISELAVFQGQLALRDIEQLEDYLMKKHKIQRCKPENQDSLLQEDEWRRQARALIALPPYRLMGQVPLSVVAQDYSVAWNRINAVTGENLRVGRIGSKFSTGSSDW